MTVIEGDSPIRFWVETRDRCVEVMRQCEERNVAVPPWMIDELNYLNMQIAIYTRTAAEGTI